MTPFWVTFFDRPSGCVEVDARWYPNADDRARWRAAETDEERTAIYRAIQDRAEQEACERGGKFGRVKAVHVLPYPAKPCLDKRSDCPPFCHSPNHCAGRTCCPRERACDD